MATDDCGDDNLLWTADIDINNNGSFDEDYEKYGTGNTASASGEYPVGTHTVYWTFKDQCGNSTTCSQEFSIVSCKAPTCYLINGLATDLMPTSDTTGMIEIWANDFDNGSHHTCGYDVVLSFSTDIFDTAITYTCIHEGLNSVTVYVTAVSPSGTPLTQPDGSLIQSFCNTTIDIQDNMNTCNIGNDGILNRIAGNIATEDDQDLLDVDVHLGDGQSMVSTGTDGMYAFADMPDGGDYDIDPFKDTDAMNGVSTLDLVLIQKHIIQLESLNSPYKMIAADVNHDESISAIDLIELRKLILGITLDFQNNESWRFVDRDYQFVNPASPLDELFPENYAITNLNSDMQIDFVAVKVGDVNNSVIANANDSSSENRSDKSLSTQNIAQGQLTTSWDKSSAQEIEKDEELFTLNFIATANGSLNGIISSNSEITKAEAYNASNEVMDLKMQVRTATDGYVLYQNTPNPFRSETNISFEIPSTQNIKINIFDVTGKVINTIEREFSKGYNTVTISKEVLNTAGVLYYSLEAGQFTATRKMVVLK